MQDASRSRYFAERCFRVVRDHPDSLHVVQFQLWGQEFLEQAQRLEAVGRSDAVCEQLSFQIEI
jgi:hypothetical protein